MANKYPFISVLLLSIALSTASAQPSVKKLYEKLNSEIKQNTVTNYSVSLINASQAAIHFQAGDEPITRQSIGNWLSSSLELRPGVDLLLLDEKVTTPSQTLSIQKLQQYYKGIRVEHGITSTLAKNGLASMAQLEFYSIPDDFNTTPAIDEATALQAAIKFSRGRIFDFMDSLGNVLNEKAPKPGLVIISSYTNDSSVCLAYKFHIKANWPVFNANVYVNAWNGSIVLSDNIAKHANVTGTADTRLSGKQNIVTGNNSGIPNKPFWLSQTRNGHYITTLDYNRNPYNSAHNYDNDATIFADNDNNWTAAEYDNEDLNNAALDVHFNMQVVSDYWATKHLRRSWNDNFGDIISYMHVAEGVWDENNVYLGVAPFDNAFWNGQNMHFGDGPTAEGPPAASIDDCAHELGHGITETTSALVYRWESGALNEGFSDIWAACITNYLKQQYPGIPGNKNVWRLFEESSNIDEIVKGLRDMKDPIIFKQPSTYKDQSNFWVPADYLTCPQLNDNNDNCGVHINSGVLNKWFYLVTEGENGTNTKGYNYSITGLGFEKSEKIAYLTSLNLTPNAGFATARIVSTEAAITLFGEASNEVKVVKDAWKAVGVDSNIYNMSNTPVFTTDVFTSIAVGAGGTIWAGTNFNGLYMFDGTNWSKKSELGNVRINNIQADRKGGIWIAQSGTQTNASQAIAGGVNYYATPFATPAFYTVSTQQQVPSRNVRCIYVDTFLLNDVTNPKVWAAMGPFQPGTGQNFKPGMLGQGLYTNSPNFKPISEGIETANNRNVLSVGGRLNEVWTYVQNNFGKSQLLKYDAATSALLATYDHTNVPEIPAGFIVRSIFFDHKYRGWFGLASGGVLLLDENDKWRVINYPNAFPPGTACNFNAICGDIYGDVYIGTTSGLVFFKHGIGENYLIDEPESFYLFTKENGLPGNNISALAFDTARYLLHVATDKGIAFWGTPCYSQSCLAFGSPPGKMANTLKSGNWSDPTIWNSNQPPDSLTDVRISHNIVIDVDAECQSLEVVNSGSIHVNTHKKLRLFQKPKPIIIGKSEE
jgi:Zn-dependent metalloprotease